MEASPLTQQARPETFQPKIVHLYEELFKDDGELEKPEGFWQEFFLHKPDVASLRRILDDLGPDDLLHFQEHPQQLFIRAIERTNAGVAPNDENALDTLTVFLGSVLNKRYTNPSSDIISVLTGLHDADAVMSDFVAALDVTIRNGRTIHIRQKAVKVALAIVSGAYSTGLVTYFMHQDLFPAIMKLVQDSDSSEQELEPFVLLGLLVNYNKFEFANPYRLRLDDFVNDAAIRKVAQGIGAACRIAREKYIAIQDDQPEGWSFGSTLAYVGLGALAPGSRPTTPTLTAEDAKTRFSALPGSEAPVLLYAYDFANANKIFCFALVTAPVEGKAEPSAISSFLSLTSYLVEHAYRSVRASLYTYLNLFTLQLLVEDQALVKQICSDESKTTVRLCRQRQPYLPIARGERPLAASILDIMIDAINHNLRRRLDVELYNLCLEILLRIISFLSRSRTRLAYHWAELWRSLLSFTRFLTTYAEDVKSLRGSSSMIDKVVNLIALSLSTGEAFLPDTGSYDDLFYKLVETGDTLTKFRDAYEQSERSKASSVETLINVSRHYHSMLENDPKNRGRKKILNPREVHKIIQQGYDTLSIQAKDGLDHWENFREADHKALLKRIARVAIDDTKDLINGSR